MSVAPDYDKVRGYILRGTRAAQPAVADVFQGALYFVTDEGVIERSNGSAWQSYSASGSPVIPFDIISPDGANLTSWIARIINEDVTGGQGWGLLVKGGSSTSDYPFGVESASGASLFNIRADGQISFGGNFLMIGTNAAIFVPYVVAGKSISVVSPDGLNSALPSLLVENQDVTSGQGNGAKITAGNDAGDFPLFVESRAGVDLFSIDGLGKIATKLPFPVIQTDTGTGSVNDFDLNDHYTILRVNNASARIYTGFTVKGAAPTAGDIVIIENIATSSVKTAYQTGSTAANQIITDSTTGQIIGGSGRILAIYDGTTSRWKAKCLESGTPISVPYANLTFSGDGTLVWTVDAADLGTMSYQQFNTKLTYFVRVTASTVAGVGTQLRISEAGGLPGGFSLSSSLIASLTPFRLSDNGVVVIGSANMFTELRFLRMDGANLTVCTNNTQLDIMFSTLVN